MVILALGSLPGRAQIELSGVWQNRFTDEDEDPTVCPARNWAITQEYRLNAAARLRAMTWDASILTLPEYQCRVYPSDYAPSFTDIRIWEDLDPNTQKLVAIHIHHVAYGAERTIWMDGRPHPPDYALHTTMGFSTGTWEGRALTVTTTHLKEGWLKRNGVPRSDRATVTEHFIRHGDHLSLVTAIHDPAYLTETMIRSRDYVYSVAGQITPYPCESVEEVIRPKGVIPHHLPGTNPFLREYQERYRIPEEGAMGGAETLYPEYRPRIIRRCAPSPEYGIDLQHERQDACRRRKHEYDIQAEACRTARRGGSGFLAARFGP